LITERPQRRFDSVRLKDLRKRLDSSALSVEEVDAITIDAARSVQRASGRQCFQCSRSQAWRQYVILGVQHCTHLGSKRLDSSALSVEEVDAITIDLMEDTAEVSAMLHA
jgi:hypothetical protein